MYMIFGLRNASQTFQRFIDQVTAGLDFVFAYIDDILIASENEEEHRIHLRTLFGCLQQYGIAINLNKCVFGKSAVNFLGHLITAEGISPSPDKVKVITEFPEPTTVKGLRRFLEMANFYNRFLKDMAQIQAPLQNQVAGHNRNSDRIVWTPELRNIFQEVK